MTPMEKIRKTLASAEKEVLIAIVKSTQQRRMKGAQGGWKDFIEAYDIKFGKSKSDPKKRSPEDMVAFLETFTEMRDLKFFEKIMIYHSNCKAIEQLNNSCTGVESSPQELVSSTWKHPEYPKCYSFSAYDEDWVMTRIGKVSKAIKSTAMLSVDCEMALCEDGKDALVQVCVVDQNLEVKLNELVKPDKPVKDYRTQIHGICAKDLERATSSLADIQKSMKKLLSPGVILIGHSLESDLKALKVDHARVIDTSLIFKYPEGHTHNRPSLNHLCKIVLGYDLREAGASHDCLADAQTAMKLVLAKLERKFVGVIPWKSKEEFKSELEHKSDEMKSEEVVGGESVELFLHAIPLKIPQKQLRGLFPKDSTVKLVFQASSIDEGVYNVCAIFKDSLEACNAYESFKVEEGKDSSGVPQKLISHSFLKDGKPAPPVSFYVRKVLKKQSFNKKADDKIPAGKRSIQVEETEKQNKNQKKRESSNRSPADIKSIQTVGTEEQNKKLKMSSDRSPYVWKRSIQVEETEEQNKKQKESSDGTTADKRSIQVEETMEQSKKHNTNSDRCDHIKEVQRLRKEVAERDSEIMNAHKVLADLLKKNGL